MLQAMLMVSNPTHARSGNKASPFVAITLEILTSNCTPLSPLLDSIRWTCRSLQTIPVTVRLFFLTIFRESEGYASYSAILGIPRIFWNPKARYLRQMNSLKSLPFYFFKIYFNIITHMVIWIACNFQSNEVTVSIYLIDLFYL
jgi:hypothetical protein